METTAAAGTIKTLKKKKRKTAGAGADTPAAATGNRIRVTAGAAGARGMILAAAAKIIEILKAAEGTTKT